MKGVGLNNNFFSAFVRGSLELFDKISFEVKHIGACFENFLCLYKTKHVIIFFSDGKDYI